MNFVWMSAIGPKSGHSKPLSRCPLRVTSGNPQSEHSESAFPPKADMEKTSLHVGFGPKADLKIAAKKHYLRYATRHASRFEPSAATICLPPYFAALATSASSQ
jgi:hypothetical protein